MAEKVERSQEEMERTLYVSNLHERVTDEILYEMMIQAGPVEYVTRPRERSFAFVVFEHEESIPYSIALMRGTQLFGRSIEMKPRDGTEQSRKINFYMDKVREMRRLAAMRTSDHRRHSNQHIQLGDASMHRGWSPMVKIGSPGITMVPQHGTSGHSRFASWPNTPNGPPSGLYPPLPPPPAPPLLRPPPQAYFPKKNDRREREDEWTPRRHNRYDEEADDRDRPHWYAPDSRRRDRSLPRADEESSNGRRSRGSHRK